MSSPKKKPTEKLKSPDWRSKRRGSPQALLAPLDTWATQLGKERRTLARMLARAGYVVKHGEKLGAAVVFNAIVGEIDHEKIRNLKADADAKERAAKIEAGELVTWSDLEKMLNEKFILPIIRALDVVPSEAQEWRDKVLLPILRQAIGAPSVEGNGK